MVGGGSLVALPELGRSKRPELAILLLVVVRAVEKEGMLETELSRRLVGVLDDVDVMVTASSEERTGLPRRGR